MADRPNIVLVHTHDTGRHLGCYGVAVPTPNLTRLAGQGVLFRQAFCGSPSCSASRTALMTGQYPHNNGVVGLVHRGFRMKEPGRHLSHLLKSAGYNTQLFGLQHEVPDPDELGYDSAQTNISGGCQGKADAAAHWIGDNGKTPFFMSVGFSETHRAFSKVESPEDPRYTAPLPWLPDSPQVRLDVAELQTDVRKVDAAVGTIMKAVSQNGLEKNTLFIYTTDHGVAFPRAKGTLFDAGTGVALIMRGPGISEGMATDALLSQIDILPTLCEYVGIDIPDGTMGLSQLEVLNGSRESVRDEVFTELTFHAAADPCRALRTARYKYIKHFENRSRWVMPNTDNGHSKYYLAGQGLPQPDRPEEYLFDLVADPQEFENLIDSTAHAEIRETLRARLIRWMEETSDPLLNGPVLPPEGSIMTPFDQFDP